MICRICQRPFHVKPSKVAKAKYCSRACKHADKVPARERFWSKVDKSGGPMACWPWRASRDKDGYGLFNPHDDRPTTRAHRFAWADENGTVPAGLDVCHSCDNPPCCNPAHYFLGTTRDNTKDRDLKGRTARGEKSGARLHPEKRVRGERHPSAKLNERAVREIRYAHKYSAASYTDSARIYGVTPQAIRAVVVGKAWAHVS